MTRRVLVWATAEERARGRSARARGWARCVALLAPVVAVLALLLVADEAEAAGVQASCARVVNDAGAGNTRIWYVGTRQAGSTDCTTSSDAFLEVNSGSSFTIYCRESTTGGIPPGGTTGTASGVFLYLIADNNNFGSPATGSIGGDVWDDCLTERSVTHYCTADGAIGGAPRYGIIRLVVRAKRGDVPTYDINSDSSGTWGIIRCRPAISTFTDTTTGGAVDPLVGGDTYRTTLAYDSVAYNAGTNARLDLVCLTSTQLVNNIEPGSSSANHDKLITGDLSTWPDECIVQQKLTITKKSAISGLTSVDYYTWDTSSAPAGVTFNGLAATRSTVRLDRTLSGPVNTWKDACAGTQTAVFIIAADLICMTEGPVVNARGATVASLTVSRTYSEPNSGASLAADSESSITTGTSSQHTKNPSAPASANWQFTATYTDGFGNTGTQTKAITFLSPYASIYHLAVLEDQTVHAPGAVMHLQVQALKQDPSGILAPFPPDAPPFYRVNYTRADGSWHTLQATQRAIATGVAPHTFWANVSIPYDWTPGRPLLFVVGANMSGLFVSSQQLLYVHPPATQEQARVNAQGELGDAERAQRIQELELKVQQDRILGSAVALALLVLVLARSRRRRAKRDPRPTATGGGRL